METSKHNKHNEISGSDLPPSAQQALAVSSACPENEKETEQLHHKTNESSFGNNSNTEGQQKRSLFAQSYSFTEEVQKAILQPTSHVSGPILSRVRQPRSTLGSSQSIQKAVQAAHLSSASSGTEEVKTFSF